MEGALVSKPVDQAKPEISGDVLRELGELQLALVGGGIGETAL